MRQFDTFLDHGAAWKAMPTACGNAGEERRNGPGGSPPLGTRRAYPMLRSVSSGTRGAYPLSRLVSSGKRAAYPMLRAISLGTRSAYPTKTDPLSGTRGAHRKASTLSAPVKAE